MRPFPFRSGSAFPRSPRRVLLALGAVSVLAAGCGAGGGDARGTCSAVHCAETASAPLAWTRPDGGARGFDLTSTGDLCPRHAAKVPFALTARFLLVFGFVPALLIGYAAFRVLYVFDRFGGTFDRLGPRGRKLVMAGIPLLAHAAWLALYVSRAW